jgi:hypothetical protein
MPGRRRAYWSDVEKLIAGPHAAVQGSPAALKILQTTDFIHLAPTAQKPVQRGSKHGSAVASV